MRFVFHGFRPGSKAQRGRCIEQSVTMTCTRRALLSRRLFHTARQPDPVGPAALAGESRTIQSGPGGETDLPVEIVFTGETRR
jgi:hypothetical protein